MERAELRKRYLELREQLKRRQFLDKQIGQYNEKLIAVERARQSHERLQKEIASLKAHLKSDNYAQLERESLIAVKAELHKLEFDPIAYASIQSQIRMQRHVEVRYQQMQRDLLDLNKINESLPPLREQLKILKDELDGELYGAGERKRLQDTQQKIRAYQYDRILHTSLKEELSALLPSTELRHELQLAITQEPKLEDSLKLYSNQLQTKQEQLQSLKGEKEKIAKSLEVFPQLEARAEELQPLIQVAREEKDTVASQLAVLEAECRNFERDLEKLNQYQNQLKEINSKLEDHLFLAEAFGKKGIQAVIIENAIPEIEAEANRILSRLSENKMHVAFITQQKTKTGGVIETLELVIGDELGTRNYELFSGGEAFKVNFAVRVALSRLLARRSGAKLETLIIDEGFGSQDEASRERLVRRFRLSRANSPESS